MLSDEAHELFGDQVCLIWHSSDSIPSEKMVQAFVKRSMRVMLTSSEHTLISAACRFSGIAKRVVLVLDHPTRPGVLDRVLDTFDRFAPDVIVWEHQPESNPPVVPFVRVVESSEFGGIAAADRTGAPIQLRLVHEDQLEDQQSETESETEIKQSGQSEIVEQQNRSRVEDSESSSSPDDKKGPSSKKVSPISRSTTLRSSDVLNDEELNALLAGELGSDS